MKWHGALIHTTSPLGELCMYFTIYYLGFHTYIHFIHLYETIHTHTIQVSYKYIVSYTLFIQMYQTFHTFVTNVSYMFQTLHTLCMKPNYIQIFKIHENLLHYRNYFFLHFQLCMKPVSYFHTNVHFLFSKQFL